MTPFSGHYIELNKVHEGTRVLFAVQIMENRTLRKLVTTRSEEILLVEHRRAHNICIELAGIRLPFPAIKVKIICCG